jgi:hypothetical protein
VPALPALLYERLKKDRGRPFFNHLVDRQQQAEKKLYQRKPLHCALDPCLVAAP